MNDDTAVAPDTRLRVQTAAAQLQYQPSSLARGLRTSATQTIGVVLPDVTNPFFSNVLRGIEAVAWEQGYQILIGDTNNDPERQLNFLRMLAGKRTDGALVLATRGDTRSLLDVGMQIPLVLACEYMEGDFFPSVSIDNVAAAYDATNHLVQLGHRRIGFINGPDEIVLSRDRLRGYLLAMKQTGGDEHAELIRNADFDIAGGRTAAADLLSQKNPPTAIFCANDEMAIGVIQAARQLGVRVPEDLAVVGFDNISMAEVVEPALTTIAQPMHELGRTAMDLLLAAMRGGPRTGRQVLPHRLVIRRSCGSHFAQRKG